MHMTKHVWSRSRYKLHHSKPAPFTAVTISKNQTVKMQCMKFKTLWEKWS